MEPGEPDDGRPQTSAQMVAWFAGLSQEQQAALQATFLTTPNATGGAAVEPPRATPTPPATAMTDLDEEATVNAPPPTAQQQPVQAQAPAPPERRRKRAIVRKPGDSGVSPADKQARPDKPSTADLVAIPGAAPDDGDAFAAPPDESHEDTHAPERTAAPPPPLGVTAAPRPPGVGAPAAPVAAPPATAGALPPTAPQPVTLPHERVGCRYRCGRVFLVDASTRKTEDYHARTCLGIDCRAGGQAPRARELARALHVDLTNVASNVNSIMAEIRRNKTPEQIRAAAGALPPVPLPSAPAPAPSSDAGTHVCHMTTSTADETVWEGGWSLEDNGSCSSFRYDVVEQNPLKIHLKGSFEHGDEQVADELSLTIRDDEIRGYGVSSRFGLHAVVGSRTANGFKLRKVTVVGVTEQSPPQDLEAAVRVACDAALAPPAARTRRGSSRNTIPVAQRLPEGQLKDALAQRSPTHGEYEWKSVAAEVEGMSPSECRTRAAQLRLWTPPSDRYTPGGRPLVSITQVVYIWDSKHLAPVQADLLPNTPCGAAIINELRNANLPRLEAAARWLYHAGIPGRGARKAALVELCVKSNLCLEPWTKSRRTTPRWSSGGAEYIRCKQAIARGNEMSYVYYAAAREGLPLPSNGRLTISDDDTAAYMRLVANFCGAEATRRGADLNFERGSQLPLYRHRSEILNAKRHPGYVSHVGYSKPEYSCYACRMLAEMRGLLVGCEHDKRAIDGKLAARLANTCLVCNTVQIEVVDGWRDQGLNEPQCGAVGAGLSAEFDNQFSFASEW